MFSVLLIKRQAISEASLGLLVVGGLSCWEQLRRQEEEGPGAQKEEQQQRQRLRQICRQVGE